MSEITKIIEDACNKICDNYCKYPAMPIPDGKSEDWLMTDDDSPCNDCPILKLIQEVIWQNFLKAIYFRVVMQK